MKKQEPRTLLVGKQLPLEWLPGKPSLQGKPGFLIGQEGESNPQRRGFCPREGVLLIADYEDKWRDLRVED